MDYASTVGAISTWIRRAIAHAARPWQAWVLLLTLIGACVWIRTSGDHATERAQLAGVVLQALGLLTVAKGLHDARRLFGRPGYVARARTFVRGFPRFRPEPVHLHASGTGVGVGTGALAVLKRGSSPDASIEERMTHLEQAVVRLQAQVTQDRRRTADSVNALAQRQEEERRLWNLGDAAIAHRLEVFSVGGLDLEVVGLLWLLAGVILGTIPSQAAAFLTR